MKRLKIYFEEEIKIGFLKYKKEQREGIFLNAAYSNASYVSSSTKLIFYLNKKGEIKTVNLTEILKTEWIEVE